MPVCAVLWDADGVLQRTPQQGWDLAVRVVEQFPGALTGTPVDETGIRAAARELGLDDSIDEILDVWSTFDLPQDGLDVVARVRAAGTACVLASNQDVLRAARMRELTSYPARLDAVYFSCDVGAAKPSAAFVGHIVADLGIFPGEALLIDDRDGNVEAARAAGLRSERWTHDDGVDRLLDLLRAHEVLVGPRLG